MTTTWLALDPRFQIDHLGYLTDIILADDPRPVAEQVNERYAHGGGWHPQPGWLINTASGLARYPGDPPFSPIAMTRINHEIVLFYPNSYVCVLQPDRSYEMARMN